MSPRSLPAYSRSVPGSPAGGGGTIKWDGERRRLGAKDVVDHGGVTRRVGEELSIVISIVRL